MLHILQLILIHPKVVAQFVDDCQADLLADFVLIGADRFNILLVKHDVVGSRGQVKTALHCLRHAVEETQNAAFAAPVVLMAGSAEYPLPEQPRYGCDCEIVVEASRASPRLP